MNIFQDLNHRSSTSYIFSNGKKYSYKNLLEDADKFSCYNSDRSLVFLVANNSYNFLVGYVGLLRGNKVVALINNTINQSSFDELIRRFKPAFIFKPNNLFSLDEKWKNKLTIGGYNLFETEIEDEYKIHDSLSMLLMTSGSTGSPEFVRLSYSNIYSNTLAICQYLGISVNDKAISTLPMSYSYGISIINTHLFSGASLILTDCSIVEKKFWNLLKKYKASTFGGVPYTYEILKKMNFSKIDLSSIKYITQAGGQLSIELLQYYQKECSDKNIDFVVMYGQTEASPRMSYLPWNMLKDKMGSIGVPICNGKLHLINDRKEIINESYVEGELVYEGENVCLGYATTYHDLSFGDLNNGKLITGDMAEFDSDGYFYITGRKKRFVKLFGNRISLDQVEKSINKAGFNCACVGVKDHIRIYTDEETDLKGIEKFILSSLKINRLSFSVKYLKKLLRNDSGKMLYSQMAEI